MKDDQVFRDYILCTSKLILGLFTHTVFYKLFSRIPGIAVGVLRTLGDSDYPKSVGTWVTVQRGKNILIMFWCGNRGMVLFWPRPPCIAWESTSGSISGEVFVSGNVQDQGQVLIKPLEIICCSVQLYPVTTEVRCVCG